MSNPVGRPRKLAAVMGSGVPDMLEGMVKKAREISTEEATVLIKLSMSGADVNDKARRALTYFLEVLEQKSLIDDDEAKVCMEVLKQSATSTQKEICNKVLCKYISKFDFAQTKVDKIIKSESTKETAISA